METAVHIVVRGVVQGVGFRYFVYRQAQQYDIVGYVRNLPDGNVEVVAEGGRSNLECFIADVKVGPPHACVSDLWVDWRSPKGLFTRFEIR